MDQSKKKSFLDLVRIEVEKHEEILSNIQGNILKKHGGDFEALVFLKFVGEKAGVKASIGKTDITSAFEQYQNAKDYKKKQQAKTFSGFYFSSKGASYLDIQNIPESEAFLNGMVSRDDLGDPPSDAWEVPYQQDIHALLLLIDDDWNNIEKLIQKYENNWKGEIKIIHIQKGVKLRNNDHQTIEHFGYVDGISQPLFYKSDFFENSKNGIHRPISEKHWNPEAPLSLVLNQEKDTGSYGSFLVYRKLEQNVKAFKESEKRLAQKLGLTGKAEEIAGAMIIGRSEKGLPIIKLGSVPNPEIISNDNDFSYKLDSSAQRCPFHAHIRKTNPRGDSTSFFGTSEQAERSHRIVRRGITYDEIGRNGDLDIHPEGGVGLLFLCFQGSIENQFEFMQKNWANNNDFPKPFTGIDPVIGQGENRKDSLLNDAEQKWKDIHGRHKASSLNNFVNMKGGEYFYAPSLISLKSL